MGGALSIQSIPIAYEELEGTHRFTTAMKAIVRRSIRFRAARFTRVQASQLDEVDSANPIHQPRSRKSDLDK